MNSYYTNQARAKGRHYVDHITWTGTLREHIRAIDLLGLLQFEGYAPQRQGNLWTMCCPFHVEDTPSFTIYPDHHWYCYGCRLHGDAVDFIRLHRNLNFVAACQYLEIGNWGQLSPLPTPIVTINLATMSHPRFYRRGSRWRSGVQPPEGEPPDPQYPSRCCKIRHDS